jgi:hypothetical protein
MAILDKVFIGLFTTNSRVSIPNSGAVFFGHIGLNWLCILIYLNIHASLQGGSEPHTVAEYVPMARSISGFE